MFRKLFALILPVVMAGFMGAAQAQESPEAFVQRISTDVLDAAKNDKSIQSGNQQQVLKLVQEKILPYVDFKRMTALAAGRYWREATPQQQDRLSSEFRDLLIYTYAGAIAQIRDQQLEFKPSRNDPSSSTVVVRSQVVQPRGEPIELDYRLAKTGDGWKIYDLNVLGAWLVETYKGNFASEISKGGIDGLINTLAERNKRLAAGGLRPAGKSS
ncbi:MlaC/ttg2D family ABC transporter substrate-binding protein [Noviherbaspirillum pedocola]|uniref:ABC transporter substrate-binding protein n=1 Tax=Noviherbaspirillum pedocola TaxID=2801341 RepID=A0A934W608_9BURK|nr:ABC transporter substrate-binding protein [Noviherbaspirillum pedocola]MBK4733798.1 ABC transporter substrate-binding protein [Noviherbaspirillum pedocola]